MRRLAAFAVLLALAASAAGQSPDGAAQRRPARAPLALDDLEPAVDVGGAPQRAAPAAAVPAPSEPAPAPAAAPLAAASVPRSGAPGGRVMDSLDLGTTSITGNQELPKVLYIVPWKKSDLGELVGRPVNTLLDEVLAPVDAEVFERHINYYESLHGDGEEE
jgi:hypothetical protein